MFTHNDKRDKECDICGKKYTNLIYLNSHQIYHEAPKFSCTFNGCTKKFFKHFKLKDHQKTHTDQRDHECQLCDKKFFTSTHLRRHHLNLHIKLKLRCEFPGCSAKCSKDKFRSHVMTKHKELSENKKQLLLNKLKNIKIIE